MSQHRLPGLRGHPGAHGQTYTPTPADLGETIRVEEQASNFYGAPPAQMSGRCAVIGETPLRGAPPVLTGNALQGDTLTEQHGTWTDAPTDFTYQWLRCAMNGLQCTAIPSAPSQTYRLSAADVGSTIAVQEAASNAYGSGTPATSGRTPVIQSSGRPTAAISGTANPKVGQATAFNASVIDSKGHPTSYRWLVNGSRAGSKSTLTYVFSHPGRQVITLQVTDSAGNSMSATLVPDVTYLRLAIQLPWDLGPGGPPFVFSQLSALSVPVGTRVVVSRSGSACWQGTRTVTAAVKTRCGRRGCRRRGSPPSMSVNLKPLLHGHAFGVGSHLTVRFQLHFWVGQADVFTFSRRSVKRTVGCLAPGQRTPGAAADSCRQRAPGRRLGSSPKQRWRV